MGEGARIGRPYRQRAVAVPTTLSPPSPPPELTASPLYFIAVLYSARRSKDHTLGYVTRHRLDALGVWIIFGNELPPPRPKSAMYYPELEISDSGRT